MPGLVAYARRSDQKTDIPKIEALARRLEPEERFRRDLYEEDCAGLGRVHLGILNPGSQPVWNADHSVALVMDGEFYDPSGLRSTLGVVEPGDVALALRLYEAYGEEFAAQVMGSFTIVVWDRREHKLLATNDRLGLHPLYYTETPGGLLLAAGVRALLADPAVSRRIDPVTIAQFLTFDHALDDHTLLAEVKLMPQAAVLTYSEGALRIRKYWIPQYASIYPLHKEDDYVDGLREHLKRAVERQTGDSLSKGVLLSGGVDSRVILAYLSKLIPPEKLHTFTWGIPNCDDARAAHEVARLIGTQHHFYELRPDWLLHKAEEAVRITDGLGNICNLHALATAEEEAAHAQVIYKGFMGDAMMGFAIRRRFFASYTPADLVAAHWDTYRDQGVITFDVREHAGVFTPEFAAEVGNGVEDGMRLGMLRSGVEHMPGQRLFFDMAQRVPRMTINGVEVVRSYAAVRLPFSDYDLWEYTLDIPPGYLFERYLYNRTFTETFPRLAKIPVAQTGMPMISCAREIWARGRKFAQWHLREAGLGRLAGPANGRPYKDYNTWFRTVLRDWVQDTLLSRQALERGYLRPEVIRQVVADHMAGKNQTGRIGALMSLELWMRQAGI